MALLLLPLDEDLTSFFTILSVQGKEVPFSFFNVPSPSALGGKSSLKDVKIKCDIEVRRLLLGFEALLQLRLNESADLPSFILELKDILENIGVPSMNAVLPPAKYYKIILAEIDSIGWNNLAHVGSDLMEISFRIFDKAGREHIVQVSLPINYPDVPPVASADLPSTLEFNWHKDANIRTILQQYEEAIGRYQDFWAVMEDIDKKFWIMEPENPSRANTFRRIAIGNHCSLSVTVNPLSPYSIPECRLFGSDMTIGPIRKKLGNNIHKWNRAQFLTENLVEVLEIVFPLREENTEDDISGNCGICYGFRLFDDDERSKDDGKEGSIPDRVCDNGNCGRPFHTNCLVEWLRSITTTRQSFDVLFGNCPYCSHPIAVKSEPYIQHEQADSEERRAILSLRSLILQESSEYEGIDDATLRRFLRARSLNVEKAHKFLLRHLQWKKQFMPEGFIRASDVHNELKKEKIFLQGVDKRGCPVGVIVANKHYGSDRDLDEFKRFIVYGMEKAVSCLPEGQEKFVMIVDLNGWSYQNIDIKGSLAVFEIMQDHFPERLIKFYLVHVPYLFWGFWKIIYPFIDPVVKQKIEFVEDKRLKSALSKDIDESQLPDIFGGDLPLVPIK